MAFLCPSRKTNAERRMAAVEKQLNKVGGAAGAQKLLSEYSALKGTNLVTLQGVDGTVPTTGPAVGSGYHLATVDECKANLSSCQAATAVDGTWAICQLADGKIGGQGYGYNITSGSFSNLGCSVQMPGELTYSDGSAVPAGKLLATVADCKGNMTQCKKAADGDGTWSICALADGKISGSGYGYAVQSGSYTNLGCSVVVPGDLQAVASTTIPANSRLATVAECQGNLAACKAQVDTQGQWGICRLADGKISGSGYGYPIQTGSYTTGIGCMMVANES